MPLENRIRERESTVHINVKININFLLNIVAIVLYKMVQKRTLWDPKG